MERLKLKQADLKKIHIQDEFWKNTTSAIDELNRIRDVEFQAFETRMDRSHEDATDALRLLCLIIVGVIAGISPVLIAVILSITRPIHRLIAYADAVAGGRLDTPQPANMRHELGALCHSLGLMLDSLRALTGMHAFFSAAIPYDGGSYGIGILSKEKPLAIRTLPMPGREEARTMIVAEFKDYVFCATHQSLTPEDQEASVPLILQATDSIGKPVFLAGDMNSHPHEKPQQLLREHFITLNDTTAHTFPADQPQECIDYIYAYAGNGHSFEVTQDTVIAEPKASDHRPVSVKVTVK